MTPGQKILLDAATLLKNEKWVQGRSDIGYTATTAIFAVSNDKISDEVCQRLRQYFAVPEGKVFILAEWNDAPGRTKAQVIEVLKEAAKAA